MTRALLINLFALFASVCVAIAQPHVDDALVIAARKALPHNISTNEIVRALSTGLWNTNKTALAIAIPKPKATVLFVFLRQPGGKYLAVDVSGMEGCNFGFLGTRRQDYDRFETKPVEWLRRDDDLFQVRMRTRAWKGRQRYTAHGGGTCVIKPDGTTIWQ
jgi:hypothetical protein